MPGKNETMTQVIGERDITTTRILSAPRELVYKAWTEPEHVSKWWGPNGFRCTIQKMDLRPGGEWLLTLHGPDGADYKNKSTFKEVKEPSLLVYDHVAPHFISTVTFDDLDGRTKVSMKMVFDSAEEMQQVIKAFNAAEGGKQTFTRMENHIHNMSWMGKADGENSQLFFSRLFDAPRPLVFEAWSNPEHLRRWFAPKGTVMHDFKMDFRKGGYLSQSMKAEDGTLFEGDGEYTEIVKPELICWTSFLKFQDPPLEVRSRVRFTDVGGKTLIVAHQLYINSGKPEGAIEGWTSTLENLGEVVAELKRK
jgi:uncharacterized protein YndB with AHSA1/START domain